MCKSMEFNNDASDKKVIIDLGFWLPQSIKVKIRFKLSLMPFQITVTRLIFRRYKVVNGLE